MNTMRKCNDEIYQLAKDQALVKKFKNKRIRPFCLCPPDVMFVTRGSKNSLFCLWFSFQLGLWPCYPWGIIVYQQRFSQPVNNIEALISNLGHTTRFWNNLHQVHSVKLREKTNKQKRTQKQIQTCILQVRRTDQVQFIFYV